MIRCAGCLLALGWLFPALAAPASNTLSHSVGTELVLPLVRCPSGCAGIRIRNTPRGPYPAGELWLECAPQQAMETNGPLIWREVTTPSQSGEPEGNQRTIRVGQ